MHGELASDIGRIEQSDAEREAAQVRCVVLDLRVERRPVITRADTSARAAVPTGGRAAQLSRADPAADVVENGLTVENSPAAADRDVSEGAADVGLQYADVDIEIAVAVRGAESIVVGPGDIRRVLEIPGDRDAVELGRLEMRVEFTGIPSGCDARIRHVRGCAVQSARIRGDQMRADVAVEARAPTVRGSHLDRLSHADRQADGHGARNPYPCCFSMSLNHNCPLPLLLRFNVQRAHRLGLRRGTRARLET